MLAWRQEMLLDLPARYGQNGLWKLDYPCLHLIKTASHGSCKTSGPLLVQGIQYAVCQEEDAGVVCSIFRPASDQAGQAAPLEVVRQVTSCSVKAAS